jgi:uncharacterized membrane protein (DUF4010 family)
MNGTVSFDQTALLNVTVALLGGLAVGIERQWSGKAAGPRPHFAGVRTFTLLGLVSGLSGWLWVAGLEGPAIVFLAGTGALVVAAYFAASRRDVDGTTEVAALVVMAAAVLAGAGYRVAASGITAVTVLLLVEKTRLHGFVSKLDLVEVRAGARFAVMATVILPLLPQGPFGPFGGIRPQWLWALVLFFSGLSFLGYIARRTLGRGRGYALAGVLGGLVSSTGATLTLARLSHSHPASGRALASGAMGASAAMFPRVLVATMVLAPDLTRVLWPAFAVPMLIGMVLIVPGWQDTASKARFDHDRNPLQVGAALQMTIVFQCVLFGVALATDWLGQHGLYGSAALMGLVDVDALTVSTAQLTTTGTAAAVTARALTIGVLANTVVKFGLAVVIGRGRFRVLTGAGLAMMALALGAALVWA